MQRNNPQAVRSQWRPKGTLVAHLGEHKAAVNQICVSPDHNFFVSCSDDGSVKIWDTARLEKNVTNRARMSYNSLGMDAWMLDSSLCVLDRRVVRYG